MTIFIIVLLQIWLTWIITILDKKKSIENNDAETLKYLKLTDVQWPLNPKDGKKEKYHAFDDSHFQIFEGNRSKT